MINVGCSYSRYDIAKTAFERYNASVLKMTMDTGSVKVEHEMTVNEAEQLAKDLMEWVHEFKPKEAEKHA